MKKLQNEKIIYMKKIGYYIFFGGILSFIGLMITGVLLGISYKTEKGKFTPNPKYHDTVYLKPDSSFGYIKFFGIIKAKDTTYFYGIEKDSNGIIIRKLIYEKNIFGQKKEN